MFDRWTLPAWASTTGGRALLLATLCLLLQQITVPYHIDIAGLQSSGSLMHAHYGLLLCIAMLDRDRRVLATCIAAVCLGWLVRAWLAGYPAPIMASGTLIFVFSYWWTMQCAHWMGWPGDADTVRRIERQDLPSLAIIGLLVYPAGLALASWLLLGAIFNLETAMSSALQTLFARHFGVLIVGLPLLAFWTERHSPDYRLRHGVASHWQWLLILLPLSMLALTASYRLRSDQLLAMSDYRYALAAGLAWVILNLRPRTAFAILVLALFGNAWLIANASGWNSGIHGLPQLASLAFSNGVILIGILYLFVLHRDSTLALQRIKEDAEVDLASGLPNLNALRRDMRAAAGDGALEMGYLLLHESDEWAAGYGIEQQSQLLVGTANHLAPLVKPYLAGTGQFALLPRQLPANPDLWQQVMRLAESASIQVNGQPVRLVAYLGVSPVDGLAQDAADAALSRASRLAFEARRLNALQPRHAGTGQDDGDSPSDHARITAHALERIRSDALQLYFQPIVSSRHADARDGLLRGEILCRLREPDGTLVPPLAFIHELETAGRSTELDLAVWRHLVERLHEHPRAARRIAFSVNLAGASMASPDFIAHMQQLLEDFPLPMEQLCIEITESALAGGSEHAIAFLEQQRQRGCSVAIDDFGTGMQGFNRLKELPINILKIDGSFVRNILGNNQDRALVRASVNIAKAFDAQTVAEYVENEALAVQLRALGVDWLQGFHLGQPRPLADVLVEMDQAA